MYNYIYIYIYIYWCIFESLKCLIILQTCEKFTFHKNLITSRLSEQQSAIYTILGELFCRGGLYKFATKTMLL